MTTSKGQGGEGREKTPGHEGVWPGGEMSPGHNKGEWPGAQTCSDVARGTTGPLLPENVLGASGAAALNRRRRSRQGSSSRSGSVRRIGACSGRLGRGCDIPPCRRRFGLHAEDGVGLGLRFWTAADPLADKSKTRAGSESPGTRVIS